MCAHDKIIRTFGLVTRNVLEKIHEKFSWKKKEINKKTQTEKKGNEISLC